MAKKLKFGNVILCEYVAKSGGNKHSLINVFSGDVMVSAFPAQLHLGLYIEYKRVNPNPLEIEFEIMINKHTMAKIKTLIPKILNESPAIISIQAFEVDAREPIQFRVLARAEGFSPTEVISKKIYQKNVEELQGD